jgi:SAM-dependent methyltransferase
MSELPLTAETAFRRYDETPDEDFYTMPRLVTHIDDHAIAAVTQLYREHFPPGGAILDVMSSWVSHLPPEIEYSRVVGLGMNAAELAANPRLDQWVVHNLNRDPRLPYGDAEFDAAGICVSIQYLVRAPTVLRDLGRVLRVGAPLVISFSNRCFPTKAVAIWQMLNDTGHMQLVQEYFRAAGNWTDVQVLDRSANEPGADPLYAVVGRSAGPRSLRPIPPAEPA